MWSGESDHGPWRSVLSVHHVQAESAWIFRVARDIGGHVSKVEDQIRHEALQDRLWHDAHGLLDKSNA